MAKQLLSIGGHLKNLIYDDLTEYPIIITDANGDGSAFDGKTLVGNASGQFVPSTIAGYITGPGSSTDNTVVRFDGITGIDVQGSGVAIDDSDNVDIPGQLTMGSSNIVITTVAGYIDPGAIDQDGASTNQVLAWNGAAWVPTSVSGVGGISGALGSTDNVLMRSDGIGGYSAQGSVVVVDDSGNTSGMGTLNTRTIANWVDGPASATDLTIPRFDGTTGKLIQGSGIAIADTTNNVSGMGTLGCGAITTTGTLTLSSAFAAISHSGASQLSIVVSGGALRFASSAAAHIVDFFRTSTAPATPDLHEIRVYQPGTTTVKHTIKGDGTASHGGLLTLSAGATITGDVTFNDAILFDDAHGMYIEPSSTTWNFGSNSASAITAAFGNAGAGVMHLTVDGDITAGDDLIVGDAVYVGTAGSLRGSLYLYNGGGGNTAGFAGLYSRNGTPWYLWVEDDGTLKVSSSVPVNNSDGTVVGAQT